MRLGVVTTSFPRSPGDPSGSFVGEHVRWLRSAGHRVTVVAAGAGDVAVPPGRLFYTGGAPEALESGAWLSALGFSVRMLAAIRRASRDWDRAFAHWVVPSGLCAALATRDLPLAVIAHSGDVHLLCRTRLATPVVAALRRRNARLAFVSEALRQRMARAVIGSSLRAYVESAAVCPMGIDTALFQMPAAPPRNRVVFVGRLVPVKGPQVLVESTAHLSADIEVVIAGDGPMRGALEARARQLGDRVRFAGTVAFDRRHETIGSADLVAVPSVEVGGGRSEGMPVVALEAMAAGVPVVASSVGGLVDVPVAVRVRPGDPRALAAAIERTLRAPPDTEPAREFARSLDWNRVGPRLDQLF